MNDREELGVLLADLRHKKGLTVRQLAELTGIGFSYISKIERGKYNAGIDIIGKLCDALGAKIEIIEGGQ